MIEDLVRLAAATPNLSVTISIRGLGHGDRLENDGSDAPSSGASSADEPSLPDGFIKEKEASQYAAIPGREITRARKRGFISHTVKDGGRDSGAILLPIVEIDRYLERRERILNFEEESPSGWPGPGGAA